MTFRNYKLIFATFLITYLSFNNVSHAVQFDDRDVKIDLPVLTTPNNAITPSISADDNGHVYVVWSDNRGGPYKVYINTKFGESGWAPRSVPINTGFPKTQGVVEDGDATSPQVCSDNSGHIYVVWVDDRAVKAGIGKKDIYFRYSKDYGITWNAPDPYTDYRIDSDNPSPGDSINPKMACDEKGNVYIIWEDDRNKSGNFDVYFRSLQVQFEKPVDFMVPYQFPEKRLNTGVTAGTFSAYSPVISTDKNGAVYVAWEDNRNMPEDDVYPGIYFNVSLNHGASWEEKAIRVDTAPVGFYITAPPVISSDYNGNVYIAWTDTAGRAERGDEYAGDGTYDVYFNVSHNNGLTWGKKDQRINSTEPADFEGLRDIGTKDVSIANNNKGVVCIVWADNTLSTQKAGRKDNFDIYSNHSENYGRSFLDFETNVRVNNIGTPAGETRAASPIVKVNNAGSVFAAWLDNRLGTVDIYFNFSAEKGKSDTWSNINCCLDNAQPIGKSYNHVMTADEKGNVYVAWQDDRSTLVKDNFNIYFISGFLDIESFLLAGQRLGEACFIATAAYGSPFEKNVVLLREFRDNFLLTNIYGRWFVKTYYNLSPPAAQFIAERPYLRAVTRIVLLPLVGVATLALKTTFLQKLLLAISITIAMFNVWWNLRTR